jgi:uncharacterized protein YbjT (DUF2867 family)
MIVVTAPTGLIGRQVLGNLLGRGEPVRVIVRDPSRLPVQARGRVEIVQGSHGDAGAVDQAFAGADAVFWLVPPDPRAGSAEAAYVDFTRPACDAFKRHQVRRAAGISALGRGTAVAGHAGLVTASLAMDDLIASSGVSYRALTMPSMAQIMSEVLGKPVRYQQIPAQALKDRLTGAGMSDAMAQATADMMAAKDQGLDNAEPRTPESTPPPTVRPWCQEILKPAVLT